MTKHEKSSSVSTSGDEIITSEALASLQVVDQKVHIGDSDYFYIPKVHVGIVYLYGVFERYVCKRLDKLHHSEEEIEILTEADFDRIHKN